MANRLWFKLASSMGLALVILASTGPSAPIMDAARRGDVDAVRALIKEGADVNVAEGDGMTPLHWAAKSGNEEMVALLLSAGAQVQPVTRIGQIAPLHLASAGGNAGIVSRMLEAGADVNLATENGTTPLHFAARSGSSETVSALLERGAPVDARDDTWQETPLMWASAYGHVDAIKVLLAAKADVSLASRVEDIPTVARAHARTRKDRIELHADRVVRPNEQRAREQDQLKEDQAKRAAQDSADQRARSNSPPPALDPNSYNNYLGKKGGLTPLLFAARQGHREAALALLEAGADINQVSADLTSPLLIATLNGRFDLSLELLKRGANPNLASHAGATPLYVAIDRQWAAQSGYPQPTAHQMQQITYLDLMEALLKAGANPNARLTKELWYEEYNFVRLFVNQQGATPFWRAAWGTDVRAMRLLLAHGADPNIPTQKPPDGWDRALTAVGGYGRVSDQDQSGLPPVPEGGPGYYPIHAASGLGYGMGFGGFIHRHAPGGWLPALQFLVEEVGVDVNARDFQGFSALHHAASRGDVELIRYLVAHGADVTVVSRRGQTTADMANSPVQRIPVYQEALSLLESLGAVNNHNCVSC